MPRSVIDLNVFFCAFLVSRVAGMAIYRLARSRFHA